MAGVEKISISLTPEMVGAVNAAVRSGQYASQSEVIREALRNWTAQKNGGLRNVEELRQLALEGSRSGPGRYGSMAAIKKEARRRYNAKKKK